MKRRIISALSVGLLVLVLLASTPGISRASVDDQDKPAPSQPSQGKPSTPGTWSAPDVPEVQTGSGFTYQGDLKDGPNPANGQYDLQFTLYDALSGGNQVADPVVVTNQIVTNGLFAVQLDFGPAAFQGSGRWLEIAVKPSGGGNYTTLSPRQALTAAPYAMSLAPGAVVSGTNASTILRVDNGGSGNGVYGLHSGSAGIEPGVRGETNSTGSGATGLLGRVTSTAPGNDSAAVRGINNGTGATGIGVWGEQYGSGWGVFGRTSTGSGVVGISGGTNQAGVWGLNPYGFGVTGSGFTGVSGTGSSGDGVRGQSDSGFGGDFSSNHSYGVYAQSDTAPAGVFSSTTSYGVVGRSASWLGGYFTSDTGYAIYGTSNGPTAAYFFNPNGNGVYAQSNHSIGIVGVSTYTDTAGIYGSNGVGYGLSGLGRTGVSGTGSSGDGVRGASNSGFGGNFSSDYSYGVYAQSNSEAAGVFSSTTSYGVAGRSANSPGGYFTSGSADAVQGHANGTNVSGVAGFNAGAGPGTYGTSGTGPGVSGLSTSGRGGTFTSSTGYGVYGQSTSNNAVYGHSSNANGVYGESDNGVGGSFQGHAISLYAQNPDIACSSCYAGYFEYDVDVNGTLSADVKQFKIDDPLDPANKYLIHTSVESPDMLNIYRGHVTLDAQGSAWVQMPDYFQALNQDFDYQLTAIGKAQPNLYVAQEIKDNKFQIAGGVPGAKVSWQVTGVRHDPYADAHRSPVEQEKAPDEKGLYKHPELYNQPASKGINSIYQQNDNKQPQSATTGNK